MIYSFGQDAALFSLRERVVGQREGKYEERTESDMNKVRRFIIGRMENGRGNNSAVVGVGVGLAKVLLWDRTPFDCK